MIAAAACRITNDAASPYAGDLLVFERAGFELLHLLKGGARFRGFTRALKGPSELVIDAGFVGVQFHCALKERDSLGGLSQLDFRLAEIEKSRPGVGLLLSRFFEIGKRLGEPVLLHQKTAEEVVSLPIRGVLLQHALEF